jgi:hypothetical protein
MTTSPDSFDACSKNQKRGCYLDSEATAGVGEIHILHPPGTFALTAAVSLKP